MDATTTWTFQYDGRDLRITSPYGGEIVLPAYDPTQVVAQIRARRRVVFYPTSADGTAGLLLELLDMPAMGSRQHRLHHCDDVSLELPPPFAEALYAFLTSGRR